MSTATELTLSSHYFFRKISTSQRESQIIIHGHSAVNYWELENLRNISIFSFKIRNILCRQIVFFLMKALLTLIQYLTLLFYHIQTGLKLHISFHLPRSLKMGLVHKFDLHRLDYMNEISYLN